jgi:PAS domain-containing protein
MKDFSRIQLTTLDHFEIAVVRVNQEGVLTYMNRAAERLLGCTTAAHVDLHALFPDEKEYRRAEAHLQQRLEGTSSTYRTSIHRPCEEQPAAAIPVNVYAFPDADPDGRPSASVALLDDMREGDARAAIHRLIATSLDNEHLLSAVAEQVRTIIPFDEFHIVMISKSRTRMRELFAMNPKRNIRELVRWWTMPPFFQQTLPDRVPEVLRIDELLANPHYAQLARNDDDTAAFFQSDVRQFLSLPVKHDNMIAAFVALYSYSDDVYTQESVDQLERLPVAEAVMAALHRDHNSRLSVIFDLVQCLGQRAADIKAVADELVNRLQKSFDWEHVSIFQYDEHADRVRLICQANHEGLALPEHFTIAGRTIVPDRQEQAFNGPIAEAAVTKQIVNTHERRVSPLATEQGFNRMVSQLAFPIAGGNTRWVLYIESRVANAFENEEIEALTTLAERAGAILAHSALFELQAALLQSISDAVIETGSDGHIRWCNAGAKAMLGITPGVAPGANVLDLAADNVAAEALRDTCNFSNRELNLRKVGRAEPFPALLSASTLPEHLAGRVYVASDFTYQKQAQRLDQLKEVFRQAAMEGRVPLALASAWLAQLAKDAPQWREDVDKILRQMARADLPLERLLRLFSAPSVAASAPSDLGKALEATLAELPASLVEAIDTSVATCPLPVAGEFNDIQFCVESMISFGLRTRPQSEKLRVTTLLEPPRAILRIEGDWVPSSRDGVPTEHLERWRRKTIYDVTLGESVIQRIVEQVGGTYSCDLDQKLCLAISLPVRAAAGAHQ